MKERPLLFSAPMVISILAGHKTQTRRLVRGPIESVEGAPYFRIESCPYGVAGDRLWVRETWGGDDCCGYAYRADHPDWPHFEGDGEQPDSPWRPSIFMPRKASRITLKLTGVRVERLQDISEEDAQAEGVECGVGLPPYKGQPYPPSYVRSFSRLWDEINGKRAPWSINPWIWCLTFRRLQP